MNCGAPGTFIIVNVAHASVMIAAKDDLRELNTLGGFSDIFTRGTTFVTFCSLL